MTLLLCRIDDRLIHGQVVVGWGRPLRIQRIVLVDDHVAASELERDLYRMAVSDPITLEFLTLAEAGDRVRELAAGSQRVLLLTGSVDTMTTLASAQPGVIKAVNVGGLHDGPGRREYLSYVYVSDDELRRLAELEAAGVRVTAQDLPDSRAVPLAAWRRVA